MQGKVSYIKLEIFKLLGIDVDTGNGVLDAVTIIALVVIIFAGLILYRRYGVAQITSRKPAKPKREGL